MGQALDIFIPPPRPKRKPSNPYPRKTASGTIPILKTGVNDAKESFGSDEVSLPEVIFMINVNLFSFGSVSYHSSCN